MIYLNLKQVRWLGVLFFQNFNKEISYFLTDLLYKAPTAGVRGRVQPKSNLVHINHK